MTNKNEKLENKFLENKSLEYKLNTGDLIFFYTEKSTSNKLIEYFSDTDTDGMFLSGMIIRDPWFTQQELSGLYLLYGFYDNSCILYEDNPEDCYHEKKIDEYLLIKRNDKYQIKLSPLSEIFDEYNIIISNNIFDKNNKVKLYYRKFKTIRDKEYNYKLSRIYIYLDNLPFQINFDSWIVEKMKNMNCTKKNVDKHVTSIWSSVLIAYILLELDYLDKNIKWYEFNPAKLKTLDITKINKNIKLEKIIELEIINYI